jgi:DNA modification methylase
LIKETTLLLGDCLDKLKELDDNSIDSIVSDPPYGLSFMGKKWDYDVPSQAIWEECMRVLKPGGHLLSFAGSRTYHRMAVRIEDAGFEIRDQIMWIYGSGFPKSHNIGKAVDKIGGKSIGWFGQWLRDWREENNITQKEIAKLFPSKTGGLTGCVANWELGLNIPTTEQFNTIIENFDLPFENIEELEREIVGTKNSACFGNEDRHTIGASKSVEVDITKGNSDWEGWGTALKPAHEPIVMARKPLVGTVANNVLEYGVGGINIDGCRIGTDDTRGKASMTAMGQNSGWNAHDNKEVIAGSECGRFPANIILDEEAGKILDEQSGTTKSGFNPNADKKQYKGGVFGGGETNETTGYTDKGGASRFFYCPKANKKDRDEGMPESVPQFTGRPRREDGSVIYKETHAEEWAEAMSKKERKDKTTLAGAEEKLQQLNGPKQIKGRDEGQDSRSVAHKARPIARMNVHPTVKPTDLMQYLIRLVTPKGGIVLDPFMGSGSTGKAAIKEGMIFVGIEREDEYYQIAKQRIEHEIKKNEPKHNFW